MCEVCISLSIVILGCWWVQIQLRCLGYFSLDVYHMYFLVFSLSDSCNERLEALRFTESMNELT